MQVACRADTSFYEAFSRTRHVIKSIFKKKNENVSETKRSFMNINLFIARSAHLSSRDRNRLAVSGTVEGNLRGVIVNVANRDEHMKEHACGMSRDIGLPRAYGEFCTCSQARLPVIPALRKSRNASQVLI